MIGEETDQPEKRRKSSGLKWLIRTALFIIFMFVLLGAVASFLPKDFSVEETIDINAYPEDVYPYLEDLDAFQTWSPWAGDSGVQDYVIGGAERGVGQESAWLCENTDCIPGSQKIIAAQPSEFVQVDLLLDTEVASAVYAIMPGETPGRLTVLIKVDRSLGGFPFIQRYLKGAKSKRMSARYQAALKRLKVQVEAEMNP